MGASQSSPNIIYSQYDVGRNIKNYVLILIYIYIILSIFYLFFLFYYDRDTSFIVKIITALILFMFPFVIQPMEYSLYWFLKWCYTLLLGDRIYKTIKDDGNYW